MRYLKTYKLFEFTETPKNTPVLYNDDNIEVKVSKTLDSAKKQNIDTYWCSSSPSGFYSHNRTANMYRINFKDGYKLRLTWDYIPQSASELGSFSGGTHWGQGGVVDGIKKTYDVFRPRKNDDPFSIDWKSEKDREIVNRIKSLPEDAKLAIMEYQEKMTREKSELINKSFKEIEKIKVIGVDQERMKVTIKYLGKEYIFSMDSFGDFYYGDDFRRDFKNKYSFIGHTLDTYLLDKTKEFLKKK